jgi:hypothetical protein
MLAANKVLYRASWGQPPEFPQPQYKKMVPFKKILSQIMNGLHTNHFCSTGTIIKFVINMEGLDADLERI